MSLIVNVKRPAREAVEPIKVLGMKGSQQLSTVEFPAEQAARLHPNLYSLGGRLARIVRYACAGRNFVLTPANTIRNPALLCVL